MDIQTIIEREFGIAVHQMTVFGQGLDSVAYLVNYETIFKQSKHEDARTALKREVRVLNYLKGKVTLQIPDIAYYSEEFGVCGYREIKGGKLTPGMYEKMRDDEKDRLAQDISLFLREMHSLPPPNIDGLEVNVTEDYKRDYAALRETIYDIIPDRSKAYLDRLYRRILSDRRITEYVRALMRRKSAGILYVLQAFATKLWRKIIARRRRRICSEIP